MYMSLLWKCSDILWPAVIVLEGGKVQQLTVLFCSTKLTLGPVSTWMGHLQGVGVDGGKPSGYVTNQLGRLSLPSLLGW